VDKKEIEYIIEAPSKFSLNFQELWQYRELFYFFTWKNIKVKYKQTVLGFLWAIIQPLIMMMIFVIFFSKALKLPTDNLPAPIFYFSGLLFWNLFSSGLNSAANSMVANANVIKKIYFPRLIIPFSGVLVAFFDFLMAFAIFVIMLIFYLLFTSDFTIGFSIFFYLPLALIISVLSTLGLGCTVAALNVKYRDFKYIIPFFIQVSLFATPVIYPVTIFESLPILKYLLAVNPMTGAIILARNPFVPEPIDWMVIGISLLFAIIIFIYGIVSFRKMEAYFADIA